MPHNESSSSYNDHDTVLIDHDDVSNYNPEQILPQPPEILRAIHAWLKPTAYGIPGGEFKKHITSHAPGTGAWLTSSPTYQQWLTGSDHGLLWIRGIPGSGKSVMAARLIEELAKENPGCPVLFFFFRQIIDANHEPGALLRDWIDQLLDYSPPLQERLAEYIEGRKKLEGLSIDDLWRDLRLGIAGLPGKVFCVGDALDEMDGGHEAFLQALGDLGQWRSSKVKVLVTSRPMPTVETPLRNVPCLHLRLQANLVDVDISTYVRFTLEGSKVPESDWKIIEDAVPGRANGLFLYAKLAMDAFLEPGASVDEVLARLPLDLNALYTGLLDEHAKRSGVDHAVQRLILQSVTHASRPLRLLELAEMIRVCGPEGSPGGLKAAKDLIRSACGPLLEILPDETVSVVHHSFTEYLKGTTRANGSSGYPVLQAGPTHADLAIACLRYVQSGCLEEVDPPGSMSMDPWGRFTSWNKNITGQETGLRLKNPLFEYAASNWHRHIVSSESAEYDQAAVNVEVRKVLGSGLVNTWLAYRWGANRVGVTQLHVAARLGLVSYVKVLLGSSEADTPDNHGKTPLWWAAYEGQTASIRELIAAGANPDQDDRVDGLKPLHQAAKKNHHGVVRLLLESGVDPLTQKTKGISGRRCGNQASPVGQMALKYACKAGHLESVDAFVPFLKDVDTIHRALAWAASEGHSKVVARLLECPGVDAKAAVNGKTLLYRACDSFDLSTIRVFLQFGANPNTGYTSYPRQFPVHGSSRTSVTPPFNCMHRICGLGPDGSRRRRGVDNATEQAIFSTLVETGADIHMPDPDGKTPLHGAVGSSPVLTRLLLNAGADADATDHGGNTPLHLAPREEIMELLLDLGNPDINRKDSGGSTALHRLISPHGIRVQAILRFLERGPDCNIHNASGDTPLHALLANWDSAAPPPVEALLQRGADPNARNRSGFTPLLMMPADSNHFHAVADVLLKAGADIDAADWEGATALLRVMKDSSLSIGEKPYEAAKCLLDRGARVSATDYMGRTLLHVAVESCQCDARPSGGSYPPDRRVDFVLSLGIDPKAVDYAGNGLLHEFALRRQNHEHENSANATELWEKLLGLGLELGLRNYAGRTPLHVLCAGNQEMDETTGLTMPIDLVIRRMEDIDVGDKEGKTALHLAVGGSQLYTKKLLDAGADPAATAVDGTTPLHVAARGGRSNTIGLLLDAMRKRQPPQTGFAAGRGSRSPGTNDVEERLRTPLQGLNARVRLLREPDTPHTPLYYACHSGRPESVRLLLDAGAYVSEGNIFTACAAFEPPPYRSPSHSELNLEQTTRIGEILDMLVENGADVSLLDVSLLDGEAKYGTTGSLEEALRYCGDYTAGCFRDAREKYLGVKNKKDDATSMVFAENLLPYLREASSKALSEFEPARRGEYTQELFHRFMVRREYRLVEELSHKISFLPNSITTLVRHGFASLLDKIATKEAAAVLEGGDWHAHGDASRPGLWFARRDVKKPDDPRRNPVPFILEAVRAELPNMQVLRLLIEKFGVDVSEAQHKRSYGRRIGVGPVDSALHYVAGGKTWWHVHEALPYLLASGAGVDARTHTGRTPLHVALGGSGPFGREAVEILIQGGANVNAVDERGDSCLAYAQHNVPMLELLIASGAQVTTDALLAAVSARSVSSLRALLASGVDPNGYCRGEPDEEEDKQDSMEAFMCDREVLLRETPLLRAAMVRCLRVGLGSFPKAEEIGVDMEIVEVLLEHGADPFAKIHKRLRRWESSDEKPAPVTDVPPGYEELTVLHYLFSKAYLVDAFLDVPGLDVNHRDAGGQTLLHVACDGYKGLDYDIGSWADEGRGVSVFQHLLSLGADLEARDNHGENILHFIANLPPSADGSNNMASLRSILADAPHLVEQRNGKGETPLHYAVRWAAFTRNVELVRVLLEWGADPHTVDNEGDIILHDLARNLDAAPLRELFEELVGKGLDPNAQNERGESPLFMFAARPLYEWNSPYSFLQNHRDEYSEEAAIPLLQRLGVDFHTRDGKGRGALHVAAEGKVERFKELMDAGVDGMVEDGAGQTAVDVAAACGNRGVLELFEKLRLRGMEHGADLGKD